MNKKYHLFLILALISGCGSNSSDPKETSNTVGVVSGFTTNSNTGAVISDVSVSIDTNNVVSGIDGSYTLTDVPTGDKTIASTKTGFKEYTGTVTITDGVTTAHDIALVPISGIDPSVLPGTSWAQCYLDASGFYIIDTFEFVDNSIFKIITDEYQDAGCTGVLVSTNTTTGTYALGATITATAGEEVTELDITLTNETSGPITPFTIYSIVFIDSTGNNLFVGADDPVLDASTPALREMTLEMQPYVK